MHIAVVIYCTVSQNVQAFLFNQMLCSRSLCHFNTLRGYSVAI